MTKEVQFKMFCWTVASLLKTYIKTLPR